MKDKIIYPITTQMNPKLTYNNLYLQFLLNSHKHLIMTHMLLLHFYFISVPTLNKNHHCVTKSYST